LARNKGARGFIYVVAEISTASIYTLVLLSISYPLLFYTPNTNSKYFTQSCH